MFKTKNMETMSLVAENAFIAEIRLMTKEEMRAEHWSKPATVIVLDNGWILYPSKDAEGNGPGVLFGVTPDGRHVMAKEGS